MADTKKPSPKDAAKGAPKEKGAAKGAGAPKAEAKEGAPDKSKAESRARPQAKERVAAPAPAAESFAVPKDYVPRLKKYYAEVVRPQLTQQFGYKNPFEVPEIEKIVLNMGVGEAVNDTKKVTAAAADLALIAGQKPIVTRARKAIATFKVRENMPIGVKVTLRKTRMYEFLDRLVNIALPRVRDFRGNRLRQGRERSRPRRRGLHDGQVRRRGPRPSAGFQLSFPAVRQGSQTRRQIYGEEKFD